MGVLKEELAEGRAKVDEMAGRLQEVLEGKEEVSSVSICTFVPVKLCQYLYVCTSKARRLQEVLEGNEKVARSCACQYLYVCRSKASTLST